MLHLRLIIFSVGGDVPINSETFFVTNFMYLKIKPTQSFRDTHRDMMYVCVYRSDCSYMYDYLCLFCL
jgi:hypothetical protein